MNICYVRRPCIILFSAHATGCYYNEFTVTVISTSLVPLMHVIAISVCESCAREEEGTFCYQQVPLQFVWPN
jgi:hypothetical protein